MTISNILVALLFIHTIKTEEYDEDVDVLAELPLQELLAQKENLGRSFVAEDTPQALPLVKGMVVKNTSHKGRRKQPLKKIFHDDEEDDKGYNVYEKKEKSKMHDILNTSLTALSYLAFGGYLVCIIVNSLREKKRKITMAYSPLNIPGTNPMGNQFVTRRPILIRFPAVTVNQGGKKRRKRSTSFPHSYHERANPTREDDYLIFNLLT